MKPFSLFKLAGIILVVLGLAALCAVTGGCSVTTPGGYKFNLEGAATKDILVTGMALNKMSATEFPKDGQQEEKPKK